MQEHSSEMRPRDAPDGFECVWQDSGNQRVSCQWRGTLAEAHHHHRGHSDFEQALRKDNDDDDD